MKFDISQKNDDQKIAMMVTAFFSYNLVTLLINTIINLFVPNTPYDTAICMAVYAVFIFFAVNPVMRRLNDINILFVFFCILIYFSNCVFYPDNADKLLEFSLSFVFTVLPLYLLGAAIRDYKILLEYLEKASHYIVPAGIAYYAILIFTGDELRLDNMSFAYYFLPFAIISFYSVVNSFTVMSLARAVLSAIVLVLAGTRGPLMCLAFGIVLLIFFYQKSQAKKLFWAAAIGAFVVFIFSDYSTVFLTKVNRFLLSHNIDNRIIVKFLESNLLDDSGRGTIIAELQTAIKEKPIFGYGIMGDRVLTKYYAHNIIVEFIVSFGLIAGVCLFVFLLVTIIKNIFSVSLSKEYKIVCIFFITCGFVKLFVSGSYIQEPTFFLLIGALFSNKYVKGFSYYDKTSDKECLFKNKIS